VDRGLVRVRKVGGAVDKSGWVEDFNVARLRGHRIRGGIHRGVGARENWLGYGRNCIAPAGNVDIVLVRGVAGRNALVVARVLGSALPRSIVVREGHVLAVGVAHLCGRPRLVVAHVRARAPVNDVASPDFLQPLKVVVLQVGNRHMLHVGVVLAAECAPEIMFMIFLWDRQCWNDDGRPRAGLRGRWLLRQDDGRYNDDFLVLAGAEGTDTADKKGYGCKGHANYNPPDRSWRVYIRFLDGRTDVEDHFRYEADPVVPLSSNVIDAEVGFVE